MCYIADLSLFFLLYCGIVLNNSWCLNVSLFLLWILSILSIIMFNVALVKPETYKHIFKKKKGKIFKTYDIITDSLFLFIIVGSGRFVLGVIFVLAMISKYTARNKFEEQFEIK